MKVTNAFGTHELERFNYRAAEGPDMTVFDQGVQHALFEGPDERGVQGVQHEAGVR